MRKALIIVGLIVAAAGGFMYYNRADSRAAQPGAAPGGGMGGGMFARPPMTVELATATRAPVAETVQVVGNLVGAQTVEVAPKVSGRLQAVEVRIGDPVRRGQLIALVEDQEIREQVKQAEASYQVSQATIRQREADLKFAETNLDRSRSLFERQLLPKQALDDAEARFQSAAAQLDLARAQFAQSTSRLDELRITLGNTRIVSPVDGFVGRRRLDAGAFVNSNAPVVDVVDIRTVRMVVNLVERDIRRISVGAPADVDVDAYPGEVFRGRIARVAPVLDPATRTAEMEIEVPNADFRLKPGMYARVNLVVGQRQDALVVPRNAVVAVDGRQGVFTIEGESRVATRSPRMAWACRNQESAREILSGLRGAKGRHDRRRGLRDGDQILLRSGPPGPRSNRAAVAHARAAAGRAAPGRRTTATERAGRVPASGPPADSQPGQPTPAGRRNAS